MIEFKPEEEHRNNKIALFHCCQRGAKPYKEIHLFSLMGTVDSNCLHGIICDDCSEPYWIDSNMIEAGKKQLKFWDKIKDKSFHEAWKIVYGDKDEDPFKNI